MGKRCELPREVCRREAVPSLLSPASSRWSEVTVIDYYSRRRSGLSFYPRALPR